MTKRKMANRYPPEARARAVRMVFDHQGSYETQAGAIAAIAPDAVVLAAFVAMTWQSDPLIVVIGILGMALVFLFVQVFLARSTVSEGDYDYHCEIA